MIKIDSGIELRQFHQPIYPTDKLKMMLTWKIISELESAVLNVNLGSQFLGVKK